MCRGEGNVRKVVLGPEEGVERGADVQNKEQLEKEQGYLVVDVVVMEDVARAKKSRLARDAHQERWLTHYDLRALPKIQVKTRADPFQTSFFTFFSSNVAAFWRLTISSS